MRYHKSKLIKTFLDSNKIKTLEWPPYSPDLNIVEDIWALMSKIVYDNKQFYNCQMLSDEITNAVNLINKSRKDDICNLYKSMAKRVVKVLLKSGKIINN